MRCFFEVEGDCPKRGNQRAAGCLGCGLEFVAEAEIHVHAAQIIADPRRSARRCAGAADIKAAHIPQVGKETDRVIDGIGRTKDGLRGKGFIRASDRHVVGRTINDVMIHKINPRPKPT